MPHVPLAGVPQSQFFDASPQGRLQMLQLFGAQGNQFSPEELTLLQLLGQRPDAMQLTPPATGSLPNTPQAQPAPQATVPPPGFFSRMFQYVYGVPPEAVNPYDQVGSALGEALQRGEASRPQQRSFSTQRPRNVSRGF